MDLYKSPEQAQDCGRRLAQIVINDSLVREAFCAEIRRASNLFRLLAKDLNEEITDEVNARLILSDLLAEFSN